MRLGILVALTAGLAAAQKPVVFAVVGDPQIGMTDLVGDRQRFAAVAGEINKLKGDREPALVFLMGDLVNRPDDKAAMEAFLEIRNSFRMPVHAVAGNHDVSTDGKGVEAGVLEQFRKQVGPDRFAFEHAGVLFVGLNSQMWVASGQPAEEQFAWLERQLRNRARYGGVFVFQHHPLYLAGASDKDEYFNTPLVWRQRLLRLFEEARVTAVFSGHLHRNLSGVHKGIGMLTASSTAKNLDNMPPGYHLLRAGADGFVQSYIPIAAK
jgi:3',5'-cyclic AMP phosphodiesterase CpdA